MNHAGPDAEVAIVGYGPVGKALAILLAELGVSVVVLERRPATYALPRAVHFDDEVGRIFQSCGIGEELRSIIEPADVYEWRNASGTTLLRFRQDGEGPCGWPVSSMFNQPTLEALLDQRARQLPGILLQRNFDVVSVEQSERSVLVRASDAKEVRASYLVGCDGANSAVRAVAGLEVRDLGYFYDWLIVDVILKAPRIFEPLNLQICDPERPTTLVSGGPGRRRWEFMRLPQETLEGLNDKERAWELLGPWGVDPGNADIERHAVYTFGARYAEEWRKGRILLAGDAAHLMPPFAGQGMCAGIRDAANLAWKLHLVIQGLAPERLLDSYVEERLPHVVDVIRLSMELGKVICVADATDAASRDEAMAAAVSEDPVAVPELPGLESGLIHPSAANAGSRFIQGKVDGHPFDEVHGVGWRLVTIDLGTLPIEPDVAEWFDSIGGRIVRLGSPDADHQRWFAEHGPFALVRPDFYLYGAAESAQEASILLGQLRRQLLEDNSMQGVSI